MFQDSTKLYSLIYIFIHVIFIISNSQIFDHESRLNKKSCLHIFLGFA